MTYFSQKLLRLLASLFVILALLVLGQIDSIALQCTEAFFPGAGVWVCLSLIFLEAIAIFYVYRALFGRPSKLVLNSEATDEERAEFVRELTLRLRKNPEVMKAGISPDDPDFVKKAMAHLDELAEREIRSSGKKVFLGTALTQNGRLDALIVFFSLCRMVWRISALYNQKPTAEEIWSVCSTVSSSTFVAFSIDALDIPQTITETMNELVPSVAPAMAASSVPLVGSAVHVFTHAMIEGAANCLLAVRAGVITRRAYRFALEGGKETIRRSCVKETGSIMLDISQETVGAIVTALKKELQDLSFGNGKKLMAHAGNLSRSIGASARQACGGVAQVAVQTVGSVRDGASEAGGRVVDMAGETMGRVNEGAQKAFSTVKNGAGSALHAAQEGVLAVGSGAGRAIRYVREKTGLAEGSKDLPATPEKEKKGLFRRTRERVGSLFSRK